MKTLVTILILAMATSANAQWSVEPGIGFVIDDNSSFAVSLKGTYQVKEPFFFEGMLLHGTDIDNSSWFNSGGREGNVVTRNENNTTHSFDHNAVFLGVGWRVKPNTTYIALSVGGVYTKTNEHKKSTTTTIKTTIVDENDPSRNIVETKQQTVSNRWRTENISPYMTLTLKKPINESLSFILSGTFYKTDLHDVIYTNIGLNYSF